MTLTKSERERRDTLFAQGFKECCDCKQVKALDEFGTNRSRRDGYRPLCKSCKKLSDQRSFDNDPDQARARQREAVRRYKEKHPFAPGEQRAQQLRCKYHITPEQFDAMLEAQGGCCAICGTDEPGGRTNQWHIDHDHSCCPKPAQSCGKCLRALLCHRCNISLPDSMEKVLQMMRYLQDHGSVTVRLAKAA